MPDIRIPETLNFTDQDIADAAARDQLNDGWYRVVTVSAERSISKPSANAKNPGSFVIKRQVAALEDPNDASTTVKPYLYDNLTLPFVNEEVQGHTKPNTQWLMYRALRAMFPDEIPEAPRRNSEGQIEFNGSIIEKEDEAAATQEVMTSVFEKCKALWEDPTQLVGQAYYAEVFTNGEYKNLRNPSQELPADAELVPPDAMKVKAAVVKKTNGKTNGKPAAAAKKGGKR